MKKDVGMTPCQKVVSGLVLGVCRILLHTSHSYLEGPSCITTFWHGIIPTSLMIFYTCILMVLLHGQFCREEVDSYTPRKVLCPCVVHVWWVGDGMPKPLRYEIKLKGTEEDYNFLLVVSPDDCIGKMCIILFEME